jgi:hypothetical protein
MPGKESDKFKVREGVEEYVSELIKLTVKIYIVQSISRICKSTPTKSRIKKRGIKQDQEEVWDSEEEE